jgi:PST family polysaccharide transporter
MINRIQNFFWDSDEKRRLLSNVFSLGILQIANYILPLVTVPYLVRVLGPEYFGLLAFATATINYFILITDYGFNLSATRQISLNRDNLEKVNEIFSSVLIIKTALMLFCLCILILITSSINKFSQNWEVYFVSFGIVVGQILFPVWLFQGMEKMKYIAYFNIIAKIFFTICIFLFVKNKTDYLFVPMLTSMGFLVVGVWSLFVARKQFGVKFRLQNFRKIKFHLKEGWYVFFSSMAISLYTISNTFLLGLYTNNTNVGYFAAVERIIQGVKGLNVPISQSIYPLIGKKMQANKKEGIIFVRKISFLVGPLMFIFSLALFILAEPIINTLLGSQYSSSIIPLRIMSFLPFIVSMSNIFGIQTMLNLGYNKEFSYFVVLTAIIGFTLTLILVPLYNIIGVSIAMLLDEIFITMMLGAFLYLKIKKGVI